MRTEEQLKILYNKFENDMKKRTRFFRFLLVLDQMGNVLFWDGSQDETISSHLYRRINLKNNANWFDKFLCKILKKIESNHCFKSRGE